MITMGFSSCSGVPRPRGGGCGALLLLAALLGGCGVPGQVRVPRGSVPQELEAQAARYQAGAPPAEGRWTRGALLREVIRRHPGLRAMAQRARGKLAQASAAEGLPAPMAMAQLWQAPLRPPFLYAHGTMWMVGIQQAFPPGKARGAEAQARIEEARMASADLSLQERELLGQTTLLAIELQEARARGSLHGGHRGLLGDLAAAVQTRQSTEAGTLLELARIDRETAAQQAEEEMAQGEEARARGALNVLLGRPPEAPLELEPEPPPGPPSEPLAALQERALRQSPELLAASLAARRDAARAEAAEQMSRAPMYTVGLNYGWMGPQDPGNHTWGATFSMSLPWLARGLAAEGQAMQAEREASRLDVDAAQLRVAQGVASAHARLQALERRRATLERRLLPASRRAVEAARTGYITGGSEAARWFEAAHELREVELMVVSADAEQARAALELALATGDIAALHRGETP
ncbi:MAG: TolC family protein [Polyangiaceae bacterium]|nr:TolC family protein [Polyangiaceae bacterium]